MYYVLKLIILIISLKGDIIVFRCPVENDSIYIKRIIGLPGEVIEMQYGRVFVNKCLLEEPYISVN